MRCGVSAQTVQPYLAGAGLQHLVQVAIGFAGPGAIHPQLDQSSNLESIYRIRPFSDAVHGLVTAGAGEYALC